MEALSGARVNSVRTEPAAYAADVHEQYPTAAERVWPESASQSPYNLTFEPHEHSRV